MFTQWQQNQQKYGLPTTNESTVDGHKTQKFDHYEVTLGATVCCSYAEPILMLPGTRERVHRVRKCTYQDEILDSNASRP